LLLGEAVPLDLEIEAFGLEDLPILDDEPAELVVIAAQGRAIDLAREAGAHADQSARVLSEDLLVDPRPIVEPVDVGHRREPHEIAVAFLVSRQEREVEERAARRPLLLEPAPRGDVGLHADNRTDALGLALAIEL